MPLASTVIVGSESLGTRDRIVLSHDYLFICLSACLTAKLLLVLASTVMLGSEFLGTNNILLSDGCGSLQTVYFVGEIATGPRQRIHSWFRVPRDS
jgi:hypothetical protein